MHVECVKEKLESAIIKAGRATGKNVTLPVLQCVLLEVSDNQLLIRATNLDLGVEVSVPVKAHQDGVVAVPSDILASYLSHISDDNVTLKQEEGYLEVSTQNAATHIKTFNHEDFPTLPEVEGGREFAVDAETVVSGVKSVVYSAATSSMKPELSSVYIAPSDQGKNLVFVATDSFRLAEKRLSVKDLPTFDYVLIPARNAMEVTRLLEEEGGSVKVVVDENQVAFQGGQMYITSRTVDGVFPDYKQIIPSEFETEATILKRDLVSALKIATIFADKFNQVTFTVSPSEKKFQLDTRNSEVGENTNQLDGALSGVDLSVTFNHKYVMDAFQSINADSVALHLNSGGKPMIMKGVSDESFTYLVMPMNR